MNTAQKTKTHREKVKAGGGRALSGAYEGFIARLEARIPDDLLVDQLERELRLGGETPDLKEMSIRQKARQDVEAHKGYKRAGGQDSDRKGGNTLIVRIVRFSEVKHGGK